MVYANVLRHQVVENRTVIAPAVPKFRQAIWQAQRLRNFKRCSPC